ncbi:pyridoxamine 5'-phosphate oxidase family protein [soil metagenome]
MATQFAAIEPKHRQFVERQHVFFVASAAPGARVNVSPNGLDALRVLDASRVVYFDRTGSGNETAAHMLADGRLTVMFCAFEGPPLILRLYGRGQVIRRGSEPYRHLLATAYAGIEPVGARQMVELTVDLVQTSCGYGVPTYDYLGERPSLDNWAAAKGAAGLEAYRHEKNERSIDGLPTGLLTEEAQPEPAE